jgi:hypothetical protein
MRMRCWGRELRAGDSTLVVFCLTDREVSVDACATIGNELSTKIEAFFKSLRM